MAWPSVPPENSICTIDFEFEALCETNYVMQLSAVKIVLFCAELNFLLASFSSCHLELLEELGCTDQVLMGRVFPTRPQFRIFLSPSKDPPSTCLKHTELTMALLVDKLRPRTLDALSYHPDLSDRLRSLVSSLAPETWATHLTALVTNCRLKAEISLICWYTVPQARARKHVSSPH